MAAPFNQSGRSVSHDPCVLLLALLWAIMLAGYAQSAMGSRASRTLASAAVRLDPNVAPWWELTALPRIGIVTAKRIVRHRDAVDAAGADPRPPAFSCAADLADVRGIGPMTVRRIRPYLTFPDQAD